jgi:hypothetical protein
MTNIEELKEEEIAQLDGELNLEDLIILGDDTKIPIVIKFPKPNGEKVTAKALVKQLTLKELEDVKIRQNNLTQSNLLTLRKSLFKQNGEKFSTSEINALPIGVVNAIATKVMELSGVELKNQSLTDF